MVIYKLFTGDKIPVYEEGLNFVQNKLNDLAKKNGRKKGINIRNLLFPNPDEKFDILSII